MTESGEFESDPKPVKKGPCPRGTCHTDKVILSKQKETEEQKQDELEAAQEKREEREDDKVKKWKVMMREVQVNADYATRTIDESLLSDEKKEEFAKLLVDTQVVIGVKESLIDQISTISDLHSGQGVCQKVKNI